MTESEWLASTDPAASGNISAIEPCTATTRHWSAQTAWRSLSS